MSHPGPRSAATALVALLAATADAGVDRTYTSDADFDEGVSVSVSREVPDQLQLGEVAGGHPFLWVAASTRGTVLRIDTRTGEILGEYRTAPAGAPTNPSRTTVDLRGNAWVSNRAEDRDADGDGVGEGSVVKVGLVTGGRRVDAGGNSDAAGGWLVPGPDGFGVNECVDRDGDGRIRTSAGLGDVLDWPSGDDLLGSLGPDADARVTEAEDECLLLFQRVPGTHARHLSVTAEGDVWSGGHDFALERDFALLDGESGEILFQRSMPCGGYGGLVDCAGILWSADQSWHPVPMADGTEGPGVHAILRYDPATDTAECHPSANSYGLAPTLDGGVWATQWLSDRVNRLEGDGTSSAGFPVASGGASGDRGAVVLPRDGTLWVANSSGSDVSRLDRNGVLWEVVPLPGLAPTGVAVDSDGNLWATLVQSDSVVRIVPDAAGPALSAVDLVVDLGAGAGPYNYSDMTGVAALAEHVAGSWQVRHDAGCRGTVWDEISWTSLEPRGTRLEVAARAADAGLALAGQPFTAVPVGGPFPPLVGRFLELRVEMRARRAGAGRCADPEGFATPVLFDLSVRGTDPRGPEIDCPEDLVLDCRDDVPDSRADATDNCGPPVVTVSESALPGPCAGSRQVERTFTATDAEGHVRSCTQRIRLEDTSPPRFDEPPPEVVVAECDPPEPPILTATDDCGPAPVVVREERRAEGPCPHAYSLLRTWSAVDACGNAASPVSQEVRVVDTTAPVIDGVPDDLTVECDAVPSPPTVTARDACDPDPDVRPEEERIPGHCPSEYTLVRTWTAGDACGNLSSARQVIEVVDTTPPVVVPGGEAIACLWPPNHWYVHFSAEDFAPEIADGCGGEISWSFVGCMSDQPDDDLGDGHHARDCVLDDDGGGFWVRSERQGTVPAGRRYGVAVAAVDACGNVSEPTVIGHVHVPHDQHPRRRDCRDATKEGQRLLPR